MPSASVSSTVPEPALPSISEWKEIVARFQKPSIPRAVWQMANTLIPYFGIWALALWSLEVSWWITAALCVLGGLFLVRIFIIFHDCCHGSYFKSKKVNDVVGFITGMLTFTPYFMWKWEHSIHHASCGDLDRRGVGDIWTMTVSEYLAAPKWKRFVYRLARNPVILFLIAPVLLFTVYQRFSKKKHSAKERWSVRWMNVALLALATVACLTIGWKAYLAIQLPMIIVAGSAGVWMFYVQHQFEDVYWDSHEEWDYTKAALLGSSFYKLPKVLQWFTGNIGYHHIHHLSPRIPNYHLEQCHYSHAIFTQVPAITFFSSLRTIMFRLWDENTRRLVGWSHLRTLRNAATA